MKAPIRAHGLASAQKGNIQEVGKWICSKAL
jgi:hypothetical protein